MVGRLAAMVRQLGLDRLGPAAAGLAVLALVLLLAFTDPAPAQRMRLAVFDSYQVAAPRVPADGAGAVVVIDIDEPSIARLGQWPWPRTDLATLTRRLGEAGAGVVAFDIVFSEADRTSPEVLAARLGEAGSALAGLPGHDALLADSFAGVPVVAGTFLDRHPIGRDFEPKAGIAVFGSLPVAYLHAYEGSLQPLPVLEAAAAGNGFVSREGDRDGIVRRVPLVALHRGVPVPSLGLEALRLALDADSPALLASDGTGEVTPGASAAVALRLTGPHGTREIPVDEAGEVWVHFPDPASQATLPAWPIITGAMSDADLARAVAGKVVFIGGSAAGLQDLVSTPLSERTAGVNVHAAAVAQILDDDFLVRPDWAFGLEVLLALVAGLALALLLPRLGALWGAVAALGAVAVIAWGAWTGFVQLSYLLDPTWPVLAIVAIYVVETLAAFWREERQRRHIHAAFDRYLSPEMVRRIAADPGSLELGGEERDMSVLMADIRGFSRISEQLSPRQVIDFLITFLTPMSEVLLAHKATLDKYIGDAILAFWNAPLDDPDHHANAARAALEMVGQMRVLNAEMPGKPGVVWPGEVKIGIGLNAGLACVGNMGSRQRLSYSLIGDTVNVASRLEGLTKLYGVPIAVGEAMAARLAGDFALLELDLVRVVGREEPARPHALLGDARLLADPAFVRLAQNHAAMLAAYRAQDWDETARLLDASAADYAALGIEGLASLYRQRVAQLRLAPPGPGWDGIYTATEK